MTTLSPIRRFVNLDGIPRTVIGVRRERGVLKVDVLGGASDTRAGHEHKRDIWSIPVDSLTFQVVLDAAKVAGDECIMRRGVDGDFEADFINWFDMAVHDDLVVAFFGKREAAAHV